MMFHFSLLCLYFQATAEVNNLAAMAAAFDKYNTSMEEVRALVVGSLLSCFPFLILS